MKRKLKRIPRNASETLDTNLRRINEALPQNVCVHMFGITAFLTLLGKLSNFWTDIRMPRRDSEDNVPWIIAYSQYMCENEIHYIFYVFEDGECNIVREINKILKEERSES